MNIKQFLPHSVGHYVNFALLFIITFILKLYNLPFMLGVSISLASVGLFLILRLYGVQKAIISAVIIHLLFVLLFQTPVFDIVFILEIICVSALATFMKRGNLVFWDLIFWIFVGGPLSILIYHLMYVQHIENVFYFQAMINVTNGLLNALLADILLAYIPFHKWMTNRRDQRSGEMYIHQILFHFSIAMIIVPFLLIVGITNLHSHQLEKGQARQVAVNTINSFELELLNWRQDDLRRLQLLGTVQRGYIEDIIQKYAGDEWYNVVVLDNDNEVIIASGLSNGDIRSSKEYEEMYEEKEISPYFYRYIPYESENELMRWGEGYYFYWRDLNVGNLSAVVVFPLSYFQQRMFDAYIDQFQTFILFVVLAMGIVYLLNRLLILGFNNLAATTTGLPRKLQQKSVIHWPDTRVYELHSLVRNFKHMSTKLVSMFNEKEEMNERLMEQAAQLRESEKSLHQFAYFDMLTSLPNRLNFQQYLQELIETYGEDRFAVIFIDLNQFKQINDTLGHVAGDELLKKVAYRLEKTISDNVKVFRLGGDEFTAVVHPVLDEDLSKLARNLEDLFIDPIDVMDMTLYVSASMGVSMYPDNGKNVDTLVKFADMAMYSSKDQGGTTMRFFDESMQSQFEEKMLIENGLRDALRHDQLELYYQPKVAADTGCITSLEVLMRWKHPVLGVVPPNKFIRVAEEVGIIYDIDRWGLFKACQRAKEMERELNEPISVSVNISAKHFHQEHILVILKQALAESKLDPSRLKIEITESVFNKDLKGVISVMDQIQQLGVSVSIDDFGIGYSSLNQLLHLPINEVKLDRQFITNIHHDSKKASVVKMIVDLAKTLQLNVVAEGIETKEESQVLNELGCHELQGYYFCRPLPEQEIIDFLKDKHL
ncbi:bifunctional diguanylate cyclase/phosphodiesterase [Halalkalibacter sp. APA_J-10(15)]|uniref:putative bifunctional diguanylate cyclase/phosphodiesterase n=1 Tax=Halalkalibacter sp. APA_J-10(15) TaxID=2933805 RepID=UPI001FF3D559|nr:EAL domain-containing protein [Halalkalibacter sp. APA_J-10(15)]MCK0469956.1 EAL domain-containing protein [Halalkalibacter sp. APA_J-10(15)]